MTPAPTPTPAPPALAPTEQTLAREEGHEADLLTAGLGAAGLMDAKAPTVTADAAGRRQWAYHSNWRGIADLSPAGGFGQLYGSAVAVPGVEIRAWLGEVGLFSPHGVLVHIPDSFDPERPCILLAPVSGSRGIYGAMATAGAWGLSHGCAVVYTDKGAGTGFYDLDAHIGVGIDGTPVPAGPQLGFYPEAGPPAPPDAVRGIAIKHAHSQDNPEASWGRMSLSAARFALLTLEQRYQGKRFNAANTRIVAASISNGGGAVLHALEEDREGLIDAAVVAAPQITVAGATSLLDYSLQAALLAPCVQLLPEMQDKPMAAFLAPRVAEFEARCANLAAKGWVQGPNVQAQARSAQARLKTLGFTDGALANNAFSVVSDVWRALAVTYTQSYARAHVDEQVCGFRFAHADANGQPRVATDADRAAWFATASGIAPTAGVQVLAPTGSAEDPSFAGLWCLREAFEGKAAMGERIRAGLNGVLADGRLPDRPVVIIHGREDGLVPVGASSRPYVESALRQGAQKLSYWEIEHAQHFDAFLAQPAFAARFVPLLPYFYQGLDQVFAHLDGGAVPAPSQVVRSQRRGLDAAGAAIPLTAAHLGSIRSEPGTDAIRLDANGLRVPE